WTGALGVGSAKPETDPEWQSFGRARLSERCFEVQHAELSARRSARGLAGRGRRSCFVPRGKRFFYLRPPAHIACCKFQDGARHRERDEVRAGGEFGGYRLPHRSSQCALAILA